MSQRNLTLLTDLYELTMMQGYFMQKDANETVVFDNHKHWRTRVSNNKVSSRKQDRNRCLGVSASLFKIDVRRADENRNLLRDHKSIRRLFHFWARCFYRLLRLWRHNDQLQSFSERGRCDNHTKPRYWSRIICSNRTSTLGGAAC